MRHIACLITLVLTLISSSAFAQGEIVVDRIMARVNDNVITRSDMVRAFPIYLQVAARISPSQLQSEEGRLRVARDLLDYMIGIRLLTDRAERDDLSVSMSDVDRYLENYRAQLEVTEGEFRRLLERDGVNYDDYREFMQGHLTRLQMLQMEALGDVEIPDDELDAELRRRYPDGFAELYFTTSHILITLPEGAGQGRVGEAFDQLMALRESILSGERTFEDVAAGTNPDGTRNRGGRVGSFAVGDLDPDYTRAALALEEGEISEPVRTQFGLHLIRLDETERRQTEDEERIRDRVRFEMRESRAARQEELYLRRLRDAAFVEVVSEDFGL